MKNNKALNIIAVILLLPAIVFFLIYLSVPFTHVTVNEGVGTYFGLCAIAGAILLKNNK